jgi:quercetin dioxygenase-like cupin family protein
MDQERTMTERLVRSSDRRVSETPNAKMATLASPTASATTGMSVWMVEMGEGQEGPPHVFDVEQVWTVLDGALTITVDGAPTALSPGDTLTLPAAVVRQVRATSDARVLACGPSGATVAVPGESAARGTPPWIA